MRLFATPNLPLAGIVDTPKVASSSIARAVISQCHPEIDRQLTGRAPYPTGYDRDNIHWQQLVPKVHANNREPIAMLIRDPIDRFISACHQFSTTPKAMLDGSANLPDGQPLTFDDPHFRSQSWLKNHHQKKHTVHVFRLEDQLRKFLAATGLDAIPRLNDAETKPQPKPTLTTGQRQQLRSIYSADVALHNSSTPARGCTSQRDHAS